MNPIEDICFEFEQYVPCSECPFELECGEEICHEFILKKILKDIKSYYDNWELT